jgi:CDP-diacylglycerol--serine O-phosphatidyltransferase
MKGSFRPFMYFYRMRTVFSFLPNLLTLFNLTCGFMAIGLAVTLPNPADHESLVFTFQMMAWCMVASAIFDVFDGWAARALKVTSAIGKDLDSLADVISFGVVPGIFCFLMMQSVWPDGWPLFPVFFGAALIPALSALRLARFNHDIRQTTDFFGVPTPFYGLLWMTLALHQSVEVSFLPVLLLWALSPMLLADIRLFSLKGFQKKGQIRFSKRIWPMLFLLGLPLLWFIPGSWGIPLVLPWYALCSRAFFRNTMLS